MNTLNNVHFVYKSIPRENTFNLYIYIYIKKTMK